jgi:hypothetical protein
MRRVLTYVGAAGAVAVWLLMINVAAAFADPVCQQTDPATGECLIVLEVPGNSGEPGHSVDASNDEPKNDETGAACYWDGRTQGITNPPPYAVACSTDEGQWSNARNCYILAANPQPPASDPSWQGHRPGDGAVYSCYQPQTQTLLWIWAQDPPANSVTGPTPREVAQIAMEHMDLRAINIGITPEPGDGSVGIVGMPVWMWAANADSHTVGPITESATAGGITVAATARVDEITWNMGDGTEVVCPTAGTPYKASYGNKRSPDCGHVYQISSSTKPGGKYTVTANSDWVITWEGAGQTGTIRLDGLTRTTEIAVGEAQVLVQ